MNSISRKRPIAAILTAAATAALLTACTGGAAAEAVTTVTVGVQANAALTVHPFLYEAHSPDHLDFEPVPIDAASDILAGVSTGSLDFGLVGVANAVASGAADQDVVVIAAANDHGRGLIGRPGMESVEDLRGHIVAYVPGGMLELTLRMELEAAGLDFDNDIEAVPLSFGDHIPGLASGRIDGFAGSTQQVVEAVTAGYPRLATLDDTPLGPLVMTLVTRRSLVEENPELVQQVVDAHIRTVQWMDANRQAWAERTVELFGLDLAIVEKQTPEFRPVWVVDDVYAAQMRAIAEQMLAHQMIDVMPDIDALVDTTFVDDFAARS